MAWKRLHQLFAWDEEMLEECSAILSNIFYRLVWKIGGVGIACVTNITLLMGYISH